MADRKSTLTLALIDGVSGPGAAVGRTLSGLGLNAKNLSGIMAGLGLAFGAVELARFGKESVTAFAEHEKTLMRLGQMYGATKQQMEGVHDAMLRVAQATAEPMADVEAAMVRMREMGFTLKQALDALPIAATAARAANAEVASMATLAPLLMRQLKIAPEDLAKAFDAVVKASDTMKGGYAAMSSGMERLLPIIHRLGWSGQEGLDKLLAYVNAIAPAMGGTEQAFSAIETIIDRLTNKKWEKRFQDAGVNLNAILAEAQRRHEDLLAAFVRAGDEAIRNAGEIGHVFMKGEEQNAWIALKRYRGLVDETFRGLHETEGLAQQRTSEYLNSAAGKLQQLSTSWDHFKEKLGETIVNAGALKFIADLQRILGEIDQRLDEMQKKGFWNVVGERGKSASEKASGQAHEFVKMLDSLGSKTRAATEGTTAEQEASDVKAREQGLLPQRQQMPQPFTTAPAPAAPPPAAAASAAPAARGSQPPWLPQVTMPPAGGAAPQPGVAPPVDFNSVFGAFNNMPDAAHQAGAATGQAFNAGLGTELNKSVGMVTQFTDWASKALGFRASPTIAPSFATAPGSQGPGSRASALTRGAFSDAGPVPTH